ncbi:ankyrin repeat and sterile alpha motif domain-containing protein 1B-like [Phlebotomus argentipes]|uniref:ankyrin repeat and sterile alpha motif domain-containing protein 1B-like n=1 Tax=Phlebotomus argentipes TaxID=94469 RepID=UPI002892B61A|nr:ankyrin repeat and sterile alpha motif domain-containing protein 1B-like [Phlebotomus argentipes]
MGKECDFLEAARQGNVLAVEKYLFQRRGGPLASLRRLPTSNVQDSNGYSALHYASLNGHTDVVRVLLIGDANPNIQDNRGSGPLHLAAWAGHHGIVKLLLGHNARPADANLLTTDLDSPLHCAAQHGHTGALTTLLAYGADPTCTNARGETAFDLAAQYGRLQAVQMLIRTHPNLLAPYQSAERHNQTPLHLAARNGHTRVVEMLLAAGMDVNVVTAAGSPLHEAALCGKDAVVRLLLTSGADLKVTDTSGRTPVDLLEQFPPHVTRRIVNVINNFQRPRSTSPCSPAKPPAAPPKPPRRNLSVSPTNLASKSAGLNGVTLREYDSNRKLKRWRHSHFIEHCIQAACCPLSPTNYLQPPTPEHAPPSVLAAETAIHLHMRPLSVAFSDQATSPETNYSASSSSDSDSEASDTLFRGIILHQRTRRPDERSRTYITHQRFDVIDRGRLGVLAPTVQKNMSAPEEIRSVDVACLLEKKEWRALSKCIELLSYEHVANSEKTSEWEKLLNSVNLGQHYNFLVERGFDSTIFLAATVHRDDVAGFLDTEYAALISLSMDTPLLDIPFNLCAWLESIHLERYASIFERHLMTTWDRVSNIWESELQAVLEIEKVGHRRRILHSITRLKSLLEQPPEICNTGKWRQTLSGSITYRAIYLGTMPIDVTPSAVTTRQTIATLKQAPRRAICLTISHRGIERHDDPPDGDAVDHTMRNIAFACQDSDDYCYFAYITREGRHLCHVFSAQSMDDATEIILTIGQCFEVAYQMALCDGE